MQADSLRTLVLACAGGLLFGCPGDDGGGADTGETGADPTGDPTTMTGPTTTVGTTMTTMDTMTTMTTDPDTGTTMAESSSGTTTGGVAPCTDIGNMAPHTENAMNAGAGDDRVGSCGGLDGEDLVFEWTAPAAGTYVIDLFASDYDTVLYVLDGGCDGTDELACSDDLQGLQSGLYVDLEADQAIGIVVDAFDAFSAGNAVLSIAATPMCEAPAATSTTVPDTVTGDSMGAGADLFSSCGGSESEDSTISFTAPADAFLRFDTRTNTAFDSILTLREGDCYGAEVACSDDAGGTTQSAAFASVTNGTVYTIVVDAFGMEAGPWEVNITDETANLSGDCCTGNGDAYCMDASQAACVCNGFSQCCDDEWTQFCAGLNQLFCDPPAACPLVAGGSCCDDNTGMGIMGCDVAEIEACVCDNIEPDCCNLEWDANCVAAAETFCLADCA